jgi:hypothetical protein
VIDTRLAPRNSNQFRYQSAAADRTRNARDVRAMDGRVNRRAIHFAVVSVQSVGLNACTSVAADERHAIAGLKLAADLFGVV